MSFHKGSFSIHRWGKIKSLSTGVLKQHNAAFSNILSFYLLPDVVPNPPAQCPAH